MGTEGPASIDSAPRLLFADERGRIYDHPQLLMVGRLGEEERPPQSDECIALPDMSRLFYLPDCPPRGLDPQSGDIVTLETQRLRGRTVRCSAVAAFLEPGFVRTLLPAADTTRKKYILPLWAYTAVGFHDGSYVASAFEVEYNPHWDPRSFDDRQMLPLLRERVMKDHENPLIHHLANCATHHHCFAAKNLFLGRWEAPLPTSRRCNARCLGCLSAQPRGSCPPAHKRIAFKPTVSQIRDVAVPHLQSAPDAIVSFGQGCEGEPLTEAPLIRDAVKQIRRKTDRGTINLNTNGSLPEALQTILGEGLDSARISLNSPRPALYNAYFRPRAYGLEDVERSLLLCREKGVFTMINYLVFPGITDQEEEWEHLREFLQRTGVNFIHLKNLCIDPDKYYRAMPREDSTCAGIRELVRRLGRAFPGVQIGYFNRPAGRPA